MSQEWTKVAEGVSLSELRQVVADMEMPKGTKMRIEMKTWASWAFDVAGAELAFKPFVPEGMILKDVYGEGGYGIVDMEADPAWLVAVLLFIKAHWLAITIAGLVLAVIISAIIVSIRVPEEAIPQLWMWAAIAIIGVAAVSRLSSTRAPPAGGRE